MSESIRQKLRSTFLDFELNDGSIVKLTLNFGLLYDVRSKYKSIYDEYNRIMTTGKMEDFLMVGTILYTAYLCANIDSENILNKEDFFLLLPFDMELLKEVQQKLTQAKKK